MFQQTEPTPMCLISELCPALLAINNHFVQQYEEELFVDMVTVAMEAVIVPTRKGDGLASLILSGILKSIVKSLSLSY